MIECACNFSNNSDMVKKFSCNYPNNCIGRYGENHSPDAANFCPDERCDKNL